MSERNRNIDSDEEENYINWKIKKLKKQVRRSRRERTARQSCSAAPPADATDADCSNKETSLQIVPKDKLEDLEPDILDILGAAPAIAVKYSEHIHEALANRIQHIATTGLASDTRKELNKRYLVPANSVLLDAPLLNVEIKLATTDDVLKQDRKIAERQKQLAVAISALARVLNKEIKDKNKDNGRLKQLMDVCRILCDVQYEESVARRELAMSSIKEELKERLAATNIERYLFSDGLSEILESFKTVVESDSVTTDTTAEAITMIDSSRFCSGIKRSLQPKK